MSFMELFALRKAKLGGKYQAPKGVTERELQEVGEEMMEGVRGDTSTKNCSFCNEYFLFGRHL